MARQQLVKRTHILAYNPQIRPFHDQNGENPDQNSEYSH